MKFTLSLIPLATLALAEPLKLSGLDNGLSSLKDIATKSFSQARGSANGENADGCYTIPTLVEQSTTYYRPCHGSSWNPSMTATSDGSAATTTGATPSSTAGGPAAKTTGGSSAASTNGAAAQANAAPLFGLAAAGLGVYAAM